VATLCQGALKGRPRDATWLYATLGEASLLLADRPGAEDWYARARRSAGNRYGDIASMRRQVQLLAPRIDGGAEILAILAMPRVALFTGHMIDAVERRVPRFPPHLEAAVRERIAQAIRASGAGFGYSSAASGGDLLFIEELLRQGAEANVILPFQRDDFVQTSIAPAGPAWVARFDQALGRAASLTYCVDENYLGDDVLFAHAGVLTQGLAALRARELETDVVNIALLDPGAGGNVGGSAATLASWSASGSRTILLDLREIRLQAPAPARTRRAPRARARPSQRKRAGVPARLPWRQREIKTLLFADIVGFSKLREQDTPAFFSQFLPLVEDAMRASGCKPAFGNTWGDGLYMVFDDVLDGAEIGLRLRDAIAGADWAAAGLPAGMSIRIGMHTGPVFRVRDPVIRQMNYYGSHVNRAARIEPVTTPGSVCVTEQMAAALAVAGSARFACDYLGTVSLAKHFGTSKLYRLRRVAETE
jgi:class 3 adenylate cyclase